MNSSDSIIRDFERGNYSRVILYGSPEYWQWHAALGLVGRTDEALSGLSRFPGPAARFYEAVALWMEGEDIDARKALGRIDIPHARNLLEVISKPVVRVLAMLPASPSGPHVILSGASRDLKFEIDNIAFRADGENIRTSADVRAVLKTTVPDFFLCQMIEWHQIPFSIGLFGCPTIGHTADFDLHIQGLKPWLNAFDEILVADHDEHAGVAPLTEAPVSVFPKAFGCPESLPRLIQRERDIDLFLSGTIFLPWHPDKAELCQQLLGNESLRLLGVNGYLSPEDYYGALSKSRLCVAYYRRYAGVVTRGIEGAAMGCVTLVPVGSVLNLYTKPESRLIEYDPASEDLGKKVKDILANYVAHYERALKTASSIRTAFAPTLVGSQYLRFCTYLAARPRPRRRPIAPRMLDRRHLVILKGWLPGGGNVKEMHKVAATNLRRWRKDLRRDDPGNRFSAINNSLRERFLMLAHRLAHHRPALWFAQPLTLNRADIPYTAQRDNLISGYKKACREFPNRLVLAFNYLRLAFHLGSERQFNDALTDLELVLSRPLSDWQIDPNDDVLSYDLFPLCFNYRTYLDTVVRILSHSDSDEDLVSPIIASLFHYRACLSDSIDDAARSYELDPEFPFYALYYSKRLSLSTTLKDRAKVIKLLSKLVEHTMLIEYAWDILVRLNSEGCQVPNWAALQQRVQRFKDGIIGGEQFDWKRPNILSLVQSLHLSGSVGPIVKRNISSSSGAKRFSIAFVDHAAAHWKAFDAFLNTQSIARSEYSSILVEVYDHVASEVFNLFEVVIISRQDDVTICDAISANYAAIVAKTDIFIIVDGIPDVEPTALENLVSAIENERTYDAVVMSGRSGSIFACRHHLLLHQWGGFDEHPAFAGIGSLVGALSERLQLSGARIHSVNDETPTAPLSTTRRNFVNAAFGKALRHRRLGEVLPPFLPSTSIDLCIRNYNILWQMQTHSFVKKSKRGLQILEGSPRGHALFGPYLTLDAGDYRVLLAGTIETPVLADAPLGTVEAVVSGESVAIRDWTADELSSSLSLMFTVPKTPQPRGSICEFRISNLQNGGWTITELTVAKATQQQPNDVTAVNEIETGDQDMFTHLRRLFPILRKKRRRDTGGLSI